MLGHLLMTPEEREDAGESEIPEEGEGGRQGRDLRYFRRPTRRRNPQAGRDIHPRNPQANGRRAHGADLPPPEMTKIGRFWRYSVLIESVDSGCFRCNFSIFNDDKNAD